MLKCYLVEQHLFGQDRARRALLDPPGPRRGRGHGALGDVGVEKCLDVVDEGVFDVDSCRLQVEGNLKGNTHSGVSGEQT